MADELGCFAEAGFTTEVVKGTSYTEALGTASTRGLERSFRPLQLFLKKRF